MLAGVFLRITYQPDLLAARGVLQVLSRYQKTGAQIDRISVKLEHSKSALINDNKMLERLYEKNKEYYEALNVYIAAGQLKLEELKHQTIPECSVFDFSFNSGMV